MDFSRPSHGNAPNLHRSTRGRFIPCRFDVGTRSGESAPPPSASRGPKQGTPRCAAGTGGGPEPLREVAEVDAELLHIQRRGHPRRERPRHHHGPLLRGECVTSFRLARLARAGADAGGSGGWPSAVRPEVVACTRPRGSGARGDSEELFQLALGGYGCFGVITEVTMRVRDNVALQMDSFSVALPGGEERASGGVIRSEDFEQIYGSVVAASAPALNGGQREEAAGDVGISRQTTPWTAWRSSWLG
ncbi:unnamed protein product [Prorocentrum cordatum]|uniref:Alkylglycerone-phosphate synthase n=1 Tax=Prorocentrum cordatum TaxID=2364126 RepID=A0ABN9U520_9DINO|nr:unnamed protein product [Polarella glacialis]